MKQIVYYLEIYVMEMTRVSPTDKLPKSLIEIAASKNKSNAIWLKISGWLCIPCCCAGATCLAMYPYINEFAILYKRLIEFYGGVIPTRVVAQKIFVQKELFTQAVIAVNNFCEPFIIDPKMNLLDLVKEFHPKFKVLLNDEILNTFLQITRNGQSHKDYKKLVWTKYIELGGNSNIFIYGFIEYIIGEIDPTSDRAKKYIIMLLNNNAFRAEIEEIGKTHVFVDT